MKLRRRQKVSPDEKKTRRRTGLPLPGGRNGIDMGRRLRKDGPSNRRWLDEVYDVGARALHRTIHDRT